MIKSIVLDKIYFVIVSINAFTGYLNTYLTLLKDFNE